MFMFIVIVLFRFSSSKNVFVHQFSCLWSVWELQLSLSTYLQNNFFRSPALPHFAHRKIPRVIIVFVVLLNFV